MPRYIPNTDEQRREMLEVIGAKSIDDLFADISPDIRLKRDLCISPAMSEMELECHMKELSGRNASLQDRVSFLGGGIYDHFIPTVVDHLVSRQEFYTSYTPYQPEISQGTLQAIFEYQTMVCELTGMDVSNASMYDEASAVAEAAVMASAVTKRGKVLIARSVSPQSRAVLATYAHCKDIDVVEVDIENGRVDLGDLESKMSDGVAALVVQNPNFFGVLEDLREIVDVVHKVGALLIVSTDLLALALLESPGRMGVDIVVGSGQSAGNAMNYGGPNFGFFAVTKKLMRKMPGRVVGQTTDRKGERGYVLTLQAREQHIRREKATSNICSNHNLNILMAAVYLSVMGREGLRKVAEMCLRKSYYAFNELIASGVFKPLFEAPFFREFPVVSEEPVKELNARLWKDGIVGGYDLGRDYPEFGNTWLVAVTEKRSRDEIDDLVRRARGK